MKMIKRIWAPTIILVIVNLTYAGAQMTLSPYTIFGAGQVEDNGFGISKAMSGTGIGFKSSNALNNINPASYSGIDSLSFMFEVGIFGKYTQFKTSNTTQGHFDGNMRYLAIGFRFTKWWSAGLGIVPYSSVGYRIQATDYIEGDMSAYTKTFTGEGGINQFYLSNSFQVFKNLSLGINTSYIFGRITQNELLSSGSNFSGYLVTKTNHVSSLYVDFGLQYTVYADKWNYTLGLIYGNKKNMKSKVDYYLASVNDTVDLKGETGEFYVPAKYGIGLGIEKDKKLKIGIDYERRDWSSSHFTNAKLTIRNSQRFSAGIEYTPYKDYRDPLFKKFYYRLGAKLEKSYLIIDGAPIDLMAASIGIGIPVRSDLSTINIALEVGKNGTTTKGLIQENYIMLHLNLSLRDLWFMKPKYD
jgi:hypothetical protein